MAEEIWENKNHKDLTFAICENPDWYTEFLAISHKSQALSFQTWKVLT